jgi:hypothetical protein
MIVRAGIGARAIACRLAASRLAACSSGGSIRPIEEL